MLQQIWLENLLFIDVETVTAKPAFDDLDEDYQQLWTHKSKFFREESEPATSYFNRASLYAEFSKIVCISVAYLKKYENNRFALRMKSFYGEDEAEILEQFRELVTNYYGHRKYIFCGHNIKEFDMPFICRRMIVNGLRLPYKLNQPGTKPPQIPMLDTFLVWKFGEFKNYTSLRLLLKTLDIDYPNELINGSEINKLFWNENDLEAIKEYCQKDVIGVAQLLLRFKGFDLLTPSDIQLSGRKKEEEESYNQEHYDDENEDQSEEESLEENTNEDYTNEETVEEMAENVAEPDSAEELGLADEDDYDLQ